MNPLLKQVLSQASTVFHGKNREVELMLCCLLARGHLLIEDIPGMGKTTLAKTLARLLGLRFNRIQFTNDLLPADILGFSIFSEKECRMVFQPGPLFGELVLGDELNRASPKTQSACLQAMEEREITIEGVTHSLPGIFLFIATQNPRDSAGTQPLPDSQLDRFLMRIPIGYPDLESERLLLEEGVGSDRRAHRIQELAPVLDAGTLLGMQNEAEKTTAAPALVDYILRLVRESRLSGEGLSPRAGLDLLRASKARAFLHGRNFVLPEDVQAIAHPVMNHRIQDVTGLISHVPVE
jgi:MoxR-like ATPase